MKVIFLNGNTWHWHFILCKYKCHTSSDTTSVFQETKTSHRDKVWVKNRDTMTDRMKDRQTRLADRAVVPSWQKNNMVDMKSFYNCTILPLWLQIHHNISTFFCSSNKTGNIIKAEPPHQYTFNNVEIIQTTTLKCPKCTLLHHSCQWQMKQTACTKV